MTNGLSESRSTMTLQTAADYNNPPIVYDAFGRADDSGSVVVDVLEGAYDPDGDGRGPRRSPGSAATRRPASSTASRSAPTAAPRPRCCRSRCTTPTGRPRSPRSTSRPPATACPTSCPTRSSSSTRARASPASSADLVAAPDGADVRLASGRRSYSASPARAPGRCRGRQQLHRHRRRRVPRPRCRAGRGHLGQGRERQRGRHHHRGRRHRPAVDPGAGGRRQAHARVPVHRGARSRPASASTSTSRPSARSSPSTRATRSGCPTRAEWSQSVDGVDVGSPEGSVVAVTRRGHRDAGRRGRR